MKVKCISRYYRHSPFYNFLIMETSIFQGNNIGKLPLTHCGSLYLFPEYRNVGLKGIERFEKFVNAWGDSTESINFIGGTIEKGKEKGINHLQWVASCTENLVLASKEFLKPVAIKQSVETRRAKIQSPNSISGYLDTFNQVLCTKLTARNIMLSIEEIVDCNASAYYSFKFSDYGLHSIYFIKNQ